MEDNLTEAQISDYKKFIDNMSQFEMCKLWRFAETGHPIFNKDNGLYNYFKERFDKLGGFTPEISKALGWGDKKL